MKEGFIQGITERKNKLEQVKVILKKKFIGIDGVIDKIIDNIALWYLTPEIQFRPLIVSLWGITGVGKTDLVRTLVNELDFTDKFIEIQMDTRHEYSRNIENYLESSGIDNTEPAILLLDEIQRYRTINEHGEMIENKHFNDIWMRLSDGKFQANSQRRINILEMLMDEMYWLDRKEDDIPEPPDTPVDSKKTKKRQSGKTDESNDNIIKKRNYKYKTSYWSANRFKKILNLKIPIEVIMEMDLEERMRIMEENLKVSNVNEGKSYEKLLIFISGNLDEAFDMAENVEDSESDADIMHELSKRVNLVHVKNALLKKFKPEQIARFGNNHIIYPCLNKKAYEIIIKMNCDEILNRVEKEHGIRVVLSEEIYEIIYRNGVFPAQGVRPAISTVFNLLGSNLPHFLHHALIKDVKQFKLEYGDKKIFTEINGENISKPIILEIDNIRSNKSIDEKMLILVHEIGHALVYALLFNTPPKQINTNSSGLSEGFVVNHNSIDNKTFIKNKIAIYMAGVAAEELVFGEEYKSAGSRMDIIFATDVAGLYVRSYGMDTTLSYILKKETQTHYQANYDVDKTNDIIENLIVEEKKKARDLLNKNMGIFKKLIKHGIESGGMKIENFLEICNNNGLRLIQKEINDKLIYSYDEKLNQFLN